MSIAEVHFNSQGNRVSSLPSLDKAINVGLNRKVVHTGEPGQDLMERIGAFPHLVEYKRLSTNQTGTFPARAHYVIAEHPDVVTSVKCTVDWIKEIDKIIVLADKGIESVVYATASINGNPKLRVGNAAFEWTKIERSQIDITAFRISYTAPYADSYPPKQ